MKKELAIGETVLFRSDGKLYEGVIKSIQGNKIEIDDKTIESRGERIPAASAVG